MAVEIDRALLDRRMLGGGFDNLSTWRTWIVVLKAAFGLPLDARERDTFRRRSTRLLAGPDGPLYPAHTCQQRCRATTSPSLCWAIGKAASDRYSRGENACS
jgi:hypothetical protein